MSLNIDEFAENVITWLAIITFCGIVSTLALVGIFVMLWRAPL